jgi:hypothetical protein
MYAQKKSIDHVRIVRERDRRRLGELFSVLCVGLSIGAFLLALTCRNLEIIRLGHEATRLQKQRTEIDNRNKALQLKLDRMTALTAVQQKAERLGFQPTDPRAIVIVETPKR